MDFEHIKKGDIAFIRVSVKYTYSYTKYFYLPRKVTRITATQFTLENGYRYKKDNGYCIGHGGRAYKEGEDAGYYGAPDLVRDQTKEYEAFKAKIEAEKGLNLLIAILSKNKLKLNSKATMDEIRDISELVQSVSTWIVKINSDS